VKWSAGAFSIAPYVVVGQRWLMARTHRIWLLLSLFSYQRELWVDAGQRQVRVRERYFGLPTSFFTYYRAGRMTAETGDRVDRFVVGLALKSGEHLPLFTFMGEGAVATGALGTLLGDDWLDMEGQQEHETRGFVERLMRLTKLGLNPSLPRQAAERLGSRCPQCGQLNAPRARCLYCGAALEARSSTAPGG
jgi:hypothetical protein